MSIFTIHYSTPKRVIDIEVIMAAGRRSMARSPINAFIRIVLIATLTYAVLFIFLAIRVSNNSSFDLVHTDFHHMQSSQQGYELIGRHQDTIDYIMVPSKPFSSVKRRLEETIVLQKNETSPLEKCSPTAAVKIKVARDDWILQSIDHSGNEKQIGGDEMYITYTDNSMKTIENGFDVPPTAVAIIEDLNNGTYILRFSTTPMDSKPRNLSGRGRIKIFFEYTCGIAMISQPFKKNWKGSGGTFENAYRDNIPEPVMKEFQPPPLPDLGQWKLVAFFGDSTMLQMIYDKNSTDLDKEKVFLRPNVYFKENIRTEFKMEAIKKLKRMFQWFHRKQMLKYKSDAAILTGSSTWDLLIETNTAIHDDFKDHLSACKYWVEYLRKTYRGRQIYWRSPTALHMHRVNCTEATYEYQNCINSTRYLSNSRVHALHLKQKALMKELDVPYIDLFETYYLSAYYTASGDGRHFVQDFNDYILGWFYPKNETTLSTK